MKTESYLEQLIQRQAHEGWSDREMARQMRIGHSTWHRIRRGERALGPGVLRRSIARFPEYRHLAILFLLGNAPDRGISATEDGQEAAR